MIKRVIESKIESALVEKYPNIQRFCANGAYEGKVADYSEIVLERFVDIPKNGKEKSEF